MANNKKSMTESLKEVLAPEQVPANEPVEDTADETVDLAAEEDKDKEITETPALDSLKHKVTDPENPKSKIETMKSVIGHLASMSSDELTKWYTQSIEQSKHVGDKPGDKHAENQSSVDMGPSNASSSTGPKTRDPMPHLGVKEDVEEMLAGYDLTEEFKERATTLFEAAVTARTILEQTRLEEEFEEKLTEAVTTVSEGLADQIDNYLTYVVEHFMTENEVAIESSLRNELMDEFIAGLADLMKNHRFSIPEEKVDAVEALSDKVMELEAKFDEQLKENTSLKEALVEVEREKIVDSFLDGLALSEADKFLKLAEGVNFDGDLETYSKKLAVVRENYFAKKPALVKSTNIVEESFEGGSVSEINIDPMIAKYMDSINRNLVK